MNRENNTVIRMKISNRPNVTLRAFAIATLVYCGQCQGGNETLDRCLGMNSGSTAISSVTNTAEPSPRQQRPDILAAMVESGKSNNQVEVGPFELNVPSDWRPFSREESAQFRSQYADQSAEIYRQFNGADDPTKTVEVAAYHLTGDKSAFVIVVISVPPTADLIPLLKNQVDEKMAYGVREGFIKRYLGLITVDTDGVSGFYIKAIDKAGNIEVSGALEHKRQKNTLIQLTLLCPTSWDEARASKTIASLLDSVNLRNR